MHDTFFYQIINHYLSFLSLIQNLSSLDSDLLFKITYYIFIIAIYGGWSCNSLFAPSTIASIDSIGCILSMYWFLGALFVFWAVIDFIVRWWIFCSYCLFSFVRLFFLEVVYHFYYPLFDSLFLFYSSNCISYTYINVFFYVLL